MPSPVITNYKIIDEAIKERLDVNANVEGAYLRAEDAVHFEVIERAASDSVSLGSGSPSTASTSSVDIERLAECVGNYIVNESDMETRSGEVDAPPPPPPPSSPDETTGTSSADPAGLAADATWDQIEEEEFRLSHGGLSREEWNELIRRLRELGEIGNLIADALEADPEMAPEIIDLLSDIQNFLDRMREEADGMSGSECMLRMGVLLGQAIYDALNRLGLGEILEGLGYVWDRDGHSRDGQVGSWDVLSRLGEDFADIFGDDLQALASEFKDKMWVQTDAETGYLYTDPNFQLLMKRVEGLYNILSALFILESAKQQIKKILTEILTDAKAEGDSKFSASDAIEGKRSNAMTRLRYLRDVLDRFVNSRSNQEYQRRSTQARKDAEEEAWDDGWNWFILVISCGTSSIMDHGTEARYQRKMEVINRQKADFEARVEAENEKVFGEMDFDSGDPFGGKIDGVIDGIDYGGLRENLGGDKLGLNADQIIRIDLALTALQNLRKVWYSLQLAKAKIKQTVAEIAQEREGSETFEGLVLGAVDNAAKFEKQAFSTLIGGMRKIVYFNNAMVDAREKAEEAEALWRSSFSSGFLGPLAPIGEMLGDPLAYDASFEGGNINFGVTDVHVQVIIDQALAAHSEPLRQILKSDQEAAKAFDELERKKWALVGELDGLSAIEEGSDGIQNLNEPYINSLRDKMAALQNMSRAILLVMRAKINLRSTLAKVIRGSGETSELISSDTLDNLGDSKRLAFELKLQNIKNRITENNRIIIEHAAREKAKWGALGAFIGIVLAVLSIVTGGLGAVAAVGVLSALATLGNSIANIIYDAVNPVDESGYGSGEFYGQTTDELVGDLAADLYNKLEKQSKDQIDTLTRDTHRNVGDNGSWFDSQSVWGLDTKAMLEVNSALVGLQNIQKVVMMVAQAKQDIKNLVAATTSGASGSDNTDLIQAGNRAAHENRLAAVSLKQEMVADIVAAHNRAVMQDADMERSIIQASISAASAVAGGVGGAIAEGWGAMEGMMEGMFWGGLVNTIINLAYTIADYCNLNTDYGTEIQKIIDDLYRVNRQSVLASLEQAVHDTISEAGQGLIVDVGSGNVVVDSVAFARLSQKLEAIFNEQMALVSVAQAQIRMKKMSARAAGIATAGENDPTLETIYQMRETALKNLDVLKQKVQEYADRLNQFNQVQRQLTLAVTSLAMQAVSAGLKFDSKLYGGDEKFSTWLNDTFDSDSTTVTVTDNDIAKEMISGGSGWDGKIGVGDLAGMAFNVLLSDNFATMVAAKIYDNVVEPCRESRNRDGERVEGGKSSSGTGSVDYYESAAQVSDIAAGNLEIEAEKLEITQQLAREFRKLMIGIIKDAKNGIGKIRQKPEAGLAATGADSDLGSEEAQEADQTTIVPDDDEIQLPPEYLQKYNELMAQEIGSPEAAIALLKQVAELNRQTFTAPEQQQMSQAALLLAAQELSTKIDSQMLKATVEEIALKITNGEMTQEEATQILAALMETPNGRAEVARVLPAIAALAGSQAVADGEAEPQSPIERVLGQLKETVALAEEQANNGSPADLGLVRQDVLKLAQLLPQQEAGLNLQVIHDNIENYTPDQLLVVLEQVRDSAQAGRITLSANELSLLDSAIEGLKNIQTQALPSNFATNFLQKVKSPNATETAEDLLSFFQAGTEEEKLAALAKIKQALFLTDGTVTLAPEQQQRLASFLGLVADLSQNPQIKQEARALYDEIAPRLPQEVESPAETQAQIALPQVSTILDGVSQVEAGRVAVLANGLPEEKEREGEELRTRSTEHGAQGGEDDDRPGFDPIFGGLGANQRIIEEHRQQVDSAALA